MLTFKTIATTEIFPVMETSFQWIGLLLLSINLSLACKGIADKEIVINRAASDPGIQKSTNQISDTLPKPIGAYMNDFESVFTKPELDSLTSQIMFTHKIKDIVFCVVTLDSSFVKPENFDEFTMELANYWGVGDRGKDNGIVICFSKGYRRLRIQNGKGIEKIISNAQTDSVMQFVIFPKFKAGDYFNGVSQGISALTEIIRGKRG